MIYKFQYIGDPCSVAAPGTTCDFNEWDVAEVRRNKENWQELGESKATEVEDKFFPKVRGKPAKSKPARG